VAEEAEKPAKLLKLQQSWTKKSSEDITMITVVKSRNDPIEDTANNHKTAVKSSIFSHSGLSTAEHCRGNKKPFRHQQHT